MITKQLLDPNGEPEIFCHECEESRKGHPIPPQELEAFIAKSIASAYAKRNVRYVWNNNRKDSNSPHFMLLMKDENVNVIVNVDYPKINNFTEMLFKFDEYGQIPRLYIAEYYCFGTNGGEPVCGGNYAIKYTPVSLLMREKESTPPQLLSDADLSKLLAKSWNELDISLIEPYLAKDLFYSSEWVFDLLPSRYEYLNYIRGKFETIRNGGNSVVASPLIYSRNGLKGILLKQNDTETFLSIKTHDGLISEMEMRDPKCLHEGIEPTPVAIETEDEPLTDADEPELYEGHGDHWEAIMPTEKYIDMLADIIQKSKMETKVRTEISMEDFDGDTDVMTLCLRENQSATTSILGYNPKANINQFITSYPTFYNGFSYKMEITKVVPWSNKVEAIVWGLIGQFELAFFATDYVYHKSKYVVGNTIEINLSGLAMNIKKAKDGFEFTGQQAINYLTKIGEKPTYLPNGEVEPVRFNTKNLVAFLQIHKRAPEDAEFQSPVLDINHTSVLDVPMTQADIIIHRRHNDENLIKIPLFFRTELLPSINIGDPIQGYLWLIGKIAPIVLKIAEQPHPKRPDISSRRPNNLDFFNYRPNDTSHIILPPDLPFPPVRPASSEPDSYSPLKKLISYISRFFTQLAALLRPPHS